MNAVTELAPLVGIVLACTILAVARATYYRMRRPRALPAPPRPTPPRALGPGERQRVLDVLHEPRFVDLAPAEVYATLLDEQRYLCSERTMYRILEANQEVRERRDQLRHHNHPRPELLATRPNELWSWDITKLLGPQKWTYFYLYVILDVFSRYVVGWMVATEESAALARKLIEETCRRQGITPEQLTLHADRGSSMTSKSVALLLADLGVTKTHSRPYVSNDNPFSESAFKTLKYRPGFPDRFDHVEQARGHCGPFFDWYNDKHHHGSLGLCTPHDVHYGLATCRRCSGAAMRPRRRLRRSPRTLHPRTPRPHRATQRGLDQQGRAGGRERTGCSVNSRTGCLTLVDRLRSSFVLRRTHACRVDEDPSRLARSPGRMPR